LHVHALKDGLAQPSSIQAAEILYAFPADQSDARNKTGFYLNARPGKGLRSTI
jgi:hypothetical protein